MVIEVGENSNEKKIDFVKFLVFFKNNIEEKNYFRKFKNFRY